MPETRADSRADVLTSGLAALLARRPDLVGVHPPADVLASTLTWAA